MKTATAALLFEDDSGSSNAVSTTVAASPALVSTMATARRLTDQRQLMSSSGRGYRRNNGGGSCWSGAAASSSSGRGGRRNSGDGVLLVGFLATVFRCERGSRWRVVAEAAGEHRQAAAPADGEWRRRQRGRSSGRQGASTDEQRGLQMAIGGGGSRWREDASRERGTGN